MNASFTSALAIVLGLLVSIAAFRAFSGWVFGV